MTTPFKPELLSPAGSLKNMRYAFAYGADAVYAGQPRYSFRVRNNEFNHANLKIGIDEAHALGKKFYVVVNIAPHNSKLKTFIKDLQNIKGDLAHNYATIPVVYGERFAKWLITLSVLLCSLPVYLLLNYFSIGWLGYFLQFMMGYLCLFLLFLWLSHTQPRYALLHNMIKLILVIGVLATATINN